MQIHSRTARRALVAAASAATLVLTLAACAGASGQPDDATNAALNPRAHGAAWQKEHFASFYDQQIDWAPCGEDEGFTEDLADALGKAGVTPQSVTCATIQAPLDWNDPENRESIELAISFVPATGDAPLGTLFSNPGGPGVSGLDFPFGLAESADFSEVLSRYNLMGFDPRGIGRSTPLTCDGTNSTLSVLQLNACLEQDPISHTMGTSQVARDLELLRVLAGDSKLNLLGYSYGTILGATYASIFPELVGRMVLDGAENAAWASPRHSFDQRVAATKAIIELGTSCQTTYRDQVSVCPFTDEASLLAVMQRLDAAPLKTSAGVEIRGTHVYGFLWDLLYTLPAERGASLDTLALALFGDQHAIDGLGEQAVNQSGARDMAQAIVTCHSFPIEPDITGLLTHINQVGMPKLMGGPEINDQTLAPYLDLSCYTVPGSGLDFSDTFDARGAAPVLVIGGTGDYATAFQFSGELVSELGNATLLTFDGPGHTVSYSQRSRCIDAAATAYLLEGTLPAAGTVCTAD